MQRHVEAERLGGLEVFSHGTRLIGSASQPAFPCPRIVRSPPDSGGNADMLGLTLSANCGHMRRSKYHCYSMTSSARASSLSGMSRPSSFAVLVLITNSNLVGCNTGKS